MTIVWSITEVWQLKYTCINSKDSILFMFWYVIDVEVNWGQKKILVQRKYILKEKQHVLSGTNIDRIAKGQRGLEDRLRIWPNRKVSHALFLSGQPWIVIAVALWLLVYKGNRAGKNFKVSQTPYPGYNWAKMYQIQHLFLDSLPIAFCSFNSVE